MRSRLLPRLRAALLAVASAAATGACDAVAATVRPFHGTAFDPPGPAPALRLPAASGAPFDLARATADSGRAALVFFGYTHCPDVCPTTLADWARVRRLLGRDADRVRFVFVTVDPARDSAAVLRRYVARFDPAAVALAPPPQALDALLRDWQVSAYPAGAPAGGHAAGHGGAAGDAAYAVAHPSRTFVVDPRGRLRLMHDAGARPADVAEDVRRLLD